IGFADQLDLLTAEGIGMFKINVGPDVADSVKRVSFQDSVSEGVCPHSSHNGENVVYGLRRQALLEQLRLK
ncbi:hypothetical protein, partial [Mesorhizobium japonicum]|uniref:hypothetical protein n=1 Tax=Mesorhizobium japonicum TaxID=2066070 RepID=UPI003B5C7A7F